MHSGVDEMKHAVALQSLDVRVAVPRGEQLGERSGLRHRLVRDQAHAEELSDNREVKLLAVGDEVLDRDRLSGCGP
jgi:hypothetical protein